MTVPTFIADYKGNIINAQDVVDMPPDSLQAKFNLFKASLEGGTRFGVGV